MAQLEKKFGDHYLVELVGCEERLLQYCKEVEEIFLQAARVSEATIICSRFYQFEPVGVSGMIFIAESHFAIHTWPEAGYAGCDILTCGKMYPDRGISFLQKSFGATEARVQVIPRGM